MTVPVFLWIGVPGFWGVDGGTDVSLVNDTLFGCDIFLAEIPERPMTIKNPTTPT